MILRLFATLFLAGCLSAQISTLPDFTGPLAEADELIVNDSAGGGSFTTQRATGRELFAPFAADPTWSSDFSASAWKTALGTTFADLGSKPTTFSGYGISDTFANIDAAVTDATLIHSGWSGTFTGSVSFNHVVSISSPEQLIIGASTEFGNAVIFTSDASLDVSIADEVILPAEFTKDEEWDTIGEIETVTGVNILTAAESYSASLPDFGGTNPYFFEETASSLSGYTVTETGGGTVALASGTFTFSNPSAADVARVTLAPDDLATYGGEFIAEASFEDIDSTQKAFFRVQNSGGTNLAAIFTNAASNEVYYIVNGASSTQKVLTNFDPTNGLRMQIKVDNRSRLASGFILYENSSTGEQEHVSVFVDQAFGSFASQVQISTSTAAAGGFDVREFRVSKKWALAVGDSITEGKNSYSPIRSVIAAGFDRASSWPYQVEQSLEGNSLVLNQGDSGDKLADLDSKLNDFLTMAPEIGSTVVVWGGSNDVTGGTTLAEMQASWGSIVGKVQATNNKLVAIEILPRTAFDSAGNTLKASWNTWLYAHGESNGYRVIRVHDLFESSSDTPFSHLFSDGTHPNVQGYTILAEQIVKYLGMSSPL